MRKGKKEEPLPQVEGYVAEKKTISILWANLLAVVLFAVVAVAGWAIMYYSLWDNLHFGGIDSLIFLVGIVLGLVVHELVHGVTWLLLLKKSFSHLSFGLMTGAVYCHIDVPMDKRKYVIGALMPLLLVGVVPWVAAILSGSLTWMLVGAVMISGAIGDIMIVWTLRSEPASTLVYDHPSEIGCYVYHKTIQQ